MGKKSKEKDGLRSLHGHYLSHVAGKHVGASGAGQEEEEAWEIGVSESGRSQASVSFQGEIYSGSWAIAEVSSKCK